jgi:hypothetical protein
MDRLWRRVAPLSGAVSIVLYFVGFALIGEVRGTASPSPDRVVDLLEGAPVQILIGAYISLVSVLLLLWFVVTLRSRLQVAGGGTGGFASLALAGGILAAAGMAVGFASIGQAAFRAEDEAIDPQIATILYDLYRAMLSGPMPIGFAALIGASAIVSFRCELFPSWLKWASVVVAVAAVSPLMFFAALFALAWVFVTSIWLTFVDGVPTTGTTTP